MRPATRDYTPLYDAERHELAYDFYIHDGGIASRWALEAKVGDKLVIGGPRGSLVVPEDYARQLYVCDESGMPALRRRLLGLRQLPARPQVTAIVTIADASYKDYLADLDGFNIEWVVGQSGLRRRASGAGEGAGGGLFYLADRRRRGGEIAAGAL